MSFRKGSMHRFVTGAGYDQNGERVRELKNSIEQAGRKAAGTPFEIYRIDNRDTMREEEFLTEIQILPGTVRENVERRRLTLL